MDIRWTTSSSPIYSVSMSQVPGRQHLYDLPRVTNCLFHVWKLCLFCWLPQLIPTFSAVLKNTSRYQTLRSIRGVLCNLTLQTDIYLTHSEILPNGRLQIFLTQKDIKLIHNKQTYILNMIMIKTDYSNIINKCICWLLFGFASTLSGCKVLSKGTLTAKCIIQVQLTTTHLQKLFCTCPLFRVLHKAFWDKVAKLWTPPVWVTERWRRLGRNHKNRLFVSTHIHMLLSSMFITVCWTDSL